MFHGIPACRRLLRAAAAIALSGSLSPGLARAQSAPAPTVAAPRAPAATRAGRDVVALRDLVPPSDPLASQDLVFDARFAREAVDGLRTGEAGLAGRLAGLPAVAHILAHARNFDYDVPKDSPAALVESLLGPPDRLAGRLATCAEATPYFSGPMLADPHLVNDVLAYLPAGFRFHGSLFLTFGYDIGVAFAPNASLNCTHPHFDDTRELLYYAIHELHHVGFMTLHPPPNLSEARTCADLLALVRYSTALEGTAVQAALPRRKADGALASDGDYAALEDEARMRADTAAYFKEYDALAARGSQPADAAAWAVIGRMSSGERLWYRVGAYMAGAIERSDGRTALVGLIEQGPDAFMARCRSRFSPRSAR